MLRPRWALPERAATPEPVWRARRAVLRSLGLGVAGALLGGGCEGLAGEHEEAGDQRGLGALPRARRPGSTIPDVYPAPRDPTYRVGRAITPARVAGGHNNFYEFSTDKERVAELAAGFASRPWTLEVAGEVARPGTFDVAALERSMPLEERVYRFRCVEAWSMVVPWTGFSLRALLARVEPTSAARFVRFVSAEDPTQMPGLRTQPWYPWPYFEALRLDEAMHPLAMLATGVYGRPLPPQHGAPIRLVVPWKYGFKSAKSVARIELLRSRPETFWSRLEPREYGFYANVDPATPHPRWSQARERLIDTGSEVPTLVYNGYGEEVAGLYPRGPSRPA
ncbi:MAG: protein-methionine-sulfoxide reductase catalytic subunit MsrP [Sandaracinus sp.]|nr:protein-methionine-sulfoxide reductase catalytic subunit MsrP [Myxococcales bacterium]MAT28466.1 protein-methionine-sulfoxide reductase catalytic subunit MsrP [Sandaracinus sp.]MBJ74109.1 protein-methionine-sulfoxide reductase catalytic subunit MsrP [Sandaracinus sp.]